MAMPPMDRKDYKAIKHFDKQKMTTYLFNVWKRGYEAGYAAAKEEAGNG